MQGASNVARGYAGLSSLYRALIAVDDPTTIPNVEFILDIEDTPVLDAPADRIVWAWNRPMKNLNTWVAPDFDGWAVSSSSLEMSAARLLPSSPSLPGRRSPPPPKPQHYHHRPSPRFPRKTNKEHSPHTPTTPPTAPPHSRTTNH